MNKKSIIAIFILLSATGFSQDINLKNVKRYSGPFKSDNPNDVDIFGKQKVGNADYEYYERPDETRVFNGVFHLSYNNSLFISGSFIDDSKNGEWKLVRISKEDSIITKRTLFGHYILGRLEGEWRDITEKTKGTKTIKIEECIANFHNNNFTGKFEYNSKQLSITGSINNSGFLDSTWIINRIEDGFIHKTILRFNKGVPCYVLERDMASSDIETLEDSIAFTDNFFAKYDTLSQTLNIDGQIFGYSSYFIELEQDYSQEISSIYTTLPESSYPLTSEGKRAYLENSSNELYIGGDFNFVEGNIIDVNHDKAFESIDKILRRWMYFVHTGGVFKITKGSNASLVYPICKISVLW